jgi:hypothetical protein
MAPVEHPMRTANDPTSHCHLTHGAARATGLQHGDVDDIALKAYDPPPAPTAPVAV